MRCGIDPLSSSTTRVNVRVRSRHDLPAVCEGASDDTLRFE